MSGSAYLYCNIIDSKTQELVQKHSTSHLGHLFMTLITCGVWFFVWWAMLSHNRYYRKMAYGDAAKLKLAIMNASDPQAGLNNSKRLAGKFGLI